MKNADLYFHYKYIGRFILFQQFSDFFINSYNLPKISKCLLYFEVNYIDDIDDLRCSNYVFLFKFFLGKRAFISKYKTLFSLGIWYHSFFVQLKLERRELYSFIYFLSNDIIPFINRNYLHINFFTYFVSYSLSDMNIFTEKKTNAGLFNLKDNLNVKFFYSGGSLKLGKKLVIFILKLI